jgi:hypothetical protein
MVNLAIIRQLAIFRNQLPGPLAIGLPFMPFGGTVRQREPTSVGIASSTAPRS